jgi:hypothetical protein
LSTNFEPKELGCRREKRKKTFSKANRKKENSGTVKPLGTHTPVNP